MTIFPALGSPTERIAVSVGDSALTYRDLARAAGSLASGFDGADRVAVWAEPSLATCIAVAAGLSTSTTLVPINPKIGLRELEHIVGDCEPELVVATPGVNLPGSLASLPHLDIDHSPRGEPVSGGSGDDDDVAVILYTSGTTGMPKGVELSRRAVTFDVDALAQAWEWTGEDVLVHGLPLFHVHGLILGVVGPLRVGCTLRHVGRFTPEAIGRALADGGTMMFGVPTMYSRIADALEGDPALAAAMGNARLLVSGSAALPTTVFERIEEVTGQQVAERYGLTETIINCAVPASGERKPGYVGPPLPGTELKIVDEDGAEIAERDDETFGEIWVRGPNLFDGYLNRADATAEAMDDGWFNTGDLAAIAPNGYVRIVGRRETDLIKTGGYKVGAGEVENALLAHPSVAEAAVVGESDDDLGERIIAYVVPAADQADPAELVEHVGTLISSHKRPHDIRFVDSLPRNAMGKVQKANLKH